MKIPHFLILLSLTSLLSACKKSDGKKINIRGFKAVDLNGNLIGQYGPADQDWSFMTSLSADEMDLFKFGEEVSLENTVSTAPMNYVVALPNPARTAQLYYLSAPDSIMVKLVLVNDRLKIAWKKAAKIKGVTFFQLDVSDRTKFPDHSSWRLYYSISAKDHVNFLFGFGDIRICDGTSVPDCF